MNTASKLYDKLTELGLFEERAQHTSPVATTIAPNLHSGRREHLTSPTYNHLEIP